MSIGYYAVVALIGVGGLVAFFASRKKFTERLGCSAFNVFLLLLGIGLIVPAFCASLKNPDALPDEARVLLDSGIPEQIIVAYKKFGNNNEYEVDCPVFPIAYLDDRTVRIYMEEIDTVGGHWDGQNPELRLHHTTIEGETHHDSWGDFIGFAGVWVNKLTWIDIHLSFSEEDYHQYIEATARLDVTYPGPAPGVNTWTNRKALLSRDLQFFIVSPEELETLQTIYPKAGKPDLGLDYKAFGLGILGAVVFCIGIIGFVLLIQDVRARG